MAKNLLAMCLVLLVASSVIYEVQGTFLLKLYLRRKMMKRAIQFTPFVCKGMLMLVSNMEHQCPATAHFKNFFTTFKSFMSFINTVSVSKSSNIDGELNSKANELFKSTSELDQSKSSEFQSTIMSMAKVLIDQKKKGSQIMTFRERRTLIWSMVKWTKMVVSFVSTAAQKSGKSIDVNSYGLDVDEKTIGGGSSESEDNSSSGSESDSGSASSTRQGSYTRKGSSDDETTSKGNDSDDTPTPTPSTGKGSNTETKTGNSDTSSKGNDDDNTPTPTPSTGKGSNTETQTGGSDKTYSNDKTSSKGKETGNGNTNTGGNTETTTSGNESKSSSKTKQTSGGTYSTNSGEGTTTTTTGGNSNSNYGANTNSGGTTETSSGSSTTSVKEVESKTSSEVMSFISNLEKKYTGNAELKVFFDKLKASMSESSKISASNSNDFMSRMKSAVGKLSDAMMFVGSRFSKSAKEKSEMQSCQEEMIKTLKELQEVNSKIVSQSQGKTVSSSQQTELKQTITKWEQVTTQFVETAASSSSSSSSSQTQMTSGMNA